jgi:hypothetical protein
MATRKLLVICRCGEVKVVRPILNLRRILSNWLPIKGMPLANGCMANVFERGEVFQLILDQQHIISNFQQIKEMLMVNGVMAIVFEMGSVFQEI